MIDLFRIAKNILADYIYDPDHIKAVPARFHKTEKGWSDNKGTSNPKFYKENAGTLSPYAMCFVEPFLNDKDEKSLSGSFNKNFKVSQNIPELMFFMSEDYETRDWMFEKVARKVSDRSNNTWNRIDDLIKHYTNVCHKDELAGSLSRLIGLSMGNGGEDWRMEKYGFKEPTNEMVRSVRLYQKCEQELLLHTGVVDKNGFLTIYRNTSHPPVKGIYIGGFIESWSLSPMIKTSQNKGKSYLISTTIPLSKVVASFVGRGGDWIHSGEYEVLVESSYLTNVRIIAEENIQVETEKRFNEIRDNYKNIDEVVESANRRNFLDSLKLENLSQIQNPTTEDLMKLRRMSPEYREMTQTELIILFKTLAKNGYFEKNGSFLDEEE